MKMTIDTAISWLPNIAEHKGEYISICNEDAEAIKIGVETMRKYQKIAEIVVDWKNYDNYSTENYYGDYLRICDIRKVLENRNVD